KLEMPIPKTKDKEKVMIQSTMSKRWLALVWTFFSATILMAQQPAAQAPDAKPAAQEPAATPPPPTGHEVSAAEIAKSNNPLAPVTAVTFENYYAPTLYGAPGLNANTFDLRGVFIAGRQIIRATVPVQTTPTGPGEYRSGLGDFAIFDAIRVSKDGAKNEWAVGPLFVAPTATNTALGSGKWQGGAALVGIFPLGRGSLMGILGTWQTSFAGDQDRRRVEVSTLQPFGTFSIGSGYYIRSSAVMVFDIEKNKYLIPLGFGFGKAFKVGNHLMNVFIEPQFTVYHKGAGQPSWQLYAGIKHQWPKKKA
ncbi:MAG TPA: hypothetical protein VMT22_08145, partial [Terriglobales bacterium]|nr:hypothetical protein [Terriglobales bacterium]